MALSSDNVKIRVRSGSNEAEVEASLTNIREVIEMIPEVLGKLPTASALPVAVASQMDATIQLPQGTPPPALAVSPVLTSGHHASIPAVNIEKGDSLSDVISKFFVDPWGRNPRRLSEVREALQSYGLNYPKQSVAVALLRLAKGSKIRRFKGDVGEYVYTAFAGAIPGPIGVNAPPEVRTFEPDSAQFVQAGAEADEAAIAPAGPEPAAGQQRQQQQQEQQGEEEEQLELNAETN